MRGMSHITQAAMQGLAVAYGEVSQRLQEHLNADFTSAHGGISSVDSDPVFDSASDKVSNHRLQFTINGHVYQVPAEKSLGGPVS